MKKSYIVFAVFTTRICDFSPDQGVFGIKIFKSS